jgi:predicted DNA-binding antitoxin AbrB/MazE fold protein
MTITVEATYENGLLRPVEPLPLAENEKVRVTVEPAQTPIWERLAALTADAPPEELAKVPGDSASQLDHYLYGAPKRPEYWECRLGRYLPMPSTGSA